MVFRHLSLADHQRIVWLAASLITLLVAPATGAAEVTEPTEATGWRLRPAPVWSPNWLRGGSEPSQRIVTAVEIQSISRPPQSTEPAGESDESQPTAQPEQPEPWLVAIFADGMIDADGMMFADGMIDADAANTAPKHDVAPGRPLTGEGPALEATSPRAADPPSLFAP